MDLLAIGFQYVSVQLVDEQKRAWHAGRGCWGEINDVNSHSIGIELDYYPSIDESFDKRQLSSLNNLLFDILKRRPEIIPKSIIGHSDMAPERKRDPGKNLNIMLIYLATVQLMIQLKNG